MYDHGKSDRPIVPEKPPNKAFGAPRAAEGVEERGLAKGNPGQFPRSRTLSRVFPEAVAVTDTVGSETEGARAVHRALWRVNRVSEADSRRYDAIDHEWLHKSNT